MSNRRPFLLFHWSPRSRRKSILRHGLCPGKRGSHDLDWRPPYVCFCRYPQSAWDLGPKHHAKGGMWDLWAVWSDHSRKYDTRNPNRRAWKTDCWWLTEYRTYQRIPKSKVWHVGSRKFTPRKKWKGS